MSMPHSGTCACADCRALDEHVPRAGERYWAGAWIEPGEAPRAVVLHERDSAPDESEWIALGGLLS